MKRRRVLFAAASASLGCAMVARPASAQPTKTVARIGLVLNNTPIGQMTGVDPQDRNVRAFVHGLRDLGLVEGRDVAIERRSALGHPERGPELLRELAGLRIDVLVTTGGPLLRAGKQAVERVPVVFVGVQDPIAAGMVRSLAHPDGNITGLMLDAGGSIHGKRLELLREIAPGISRVAVLLPKLPGSLPFWSPEVEAAARALQLKLMRVAVDAAEDFDDAFAGMVRDGAQAVYAPQSGPNFGSMRRIVEFAARQRLPAIYELREYAQKGGLISYGTDLADLFRRAAAYVDRILKGTKPADLPVEQPTKFELVINLNTARALGLSVPQSLLLRADEVIE
jgi:putative ABC transport system substrate-binding protein